MIPEELRKKLEEAAEKYFIDTEYAPQYRDATISDFLAGAEIGFKEAIKDAKEWLAIKGIFGGNTCGDLKQYIIDFETYMKNIWEEKK